MYSRHFLTCIMCKLYIFNAILCILYAFLETCTICPHFVLLLSFFTVFYCSFLTIANVELVSTLHQWRKKGMTQHYALWSFNMKLHYVRTLCIQYPTRARPPYRVWIFSFWLGKIPFNLELVWGIHDKSSKKV